MLQFLPLTKIVKQVIIDNLPKGIIDDNKSVNFKLGNGNVN